MTAVSEPAADLTAWLPALRALITQPDSDGTRVHGKPGSRPPWNSAVANVWMDVHAGVRELEQDLRYTVTGSYQTRGGSDANTVRAIEAIQALASGVDQAYAANVAHILHRFVTVIMQLPAVDLEEKPQRVRADCPYCGTNMLRVMPRSGRVTCLRYGACFDGDGQHPVGEIGRSQLDGTPMVAWRDGLVT